MRLDFVRRTVHDVHTAAVSLPSRDARGKVLVGVGNAPVVLFFKFVFRCIWSGVAAKPELLNKLVALLIVRELLEDRLFFRGDDVANVFVQPFFIGIADLMFKSLRVSLFFLLSKRALERINFIRFARGLLLVSALCLGAVGSLRIISRNSSRRLRPTWGCRYEQP